MLTCIFCKTHYEKGSGISLHKFPKDGTLHRWLNNMKIQNFYASDNDRICSKHFTPECFAKHKTRTALKRNSIPTIFYSKTGPTSSTSIQKHDLIENIGICKTSKMQHSKIKRLLQPNSNMEQDPLGKCILGRPIKMEIEENHDPSCLCLTRKYDEEHNRFPPKAISEVWGDVKHDHSYQTNTPTSSKKAMEEIQNNLKIARTRIKVLSQHVKRLKTKVTSLKDINSKLRKRKVMGDEFVDMLNENNDVKAQLFKRIFFNSRKHISHAGYPKELRTFALTLYAYSPQAYTYVRKKLNLALPHPRMVRSWRSTFVAKSGLTLENSKSFNVEEPGIFSDQDCMEQVNKERAAELSCEFNSVQDDLEHVNSGSHSEFTLDQAEAEHFHSANGSPSEFTSLQVGIEHASDTEQNRHDEMEQADDASETSCNYTLLQDGMEHINSASEKPYKHTLLQDGMEHVKNATELPYKLTLINEIEDVNSSKKRKKSTKQNRKKKNNLNFKMGDLIDNLIVKI